MAQRDSTGVSSLSELLDGGQESIVYGFAFHQAYGYLRDVERKMCSAIGWKDSARPYDFEGFSGWHLRFDKKDFGRVDVMLDGDVRATFKALPGGSLGFEPKGEEFLAYPENVNPWYPLADIMDGRFCLEKGNLALAREECHHGQEVVFGFRIGDDMAVACENTDERLRNALSVESSGLRFVSDDKFGNLLGNWVDRECVPGFESTPRPQLVLFTWDGETLRSEKDVVNSISPGGFELWDSDRKAIAELRKEGRKLRSELNEAAGVGRNKLFKFSKAVYPSDWIRDDALFLSSANGLGMSDFVTVARGKVLLYRGQYDIDAHLSVPKRTFDSVGDAVAALRSVILCEANVKSAKADYALYLKNKQQNKPVGVKRDPGIK